jgi:hypothetical protein
MAGEARAYPQKYWWVVLVALPIVLALITMFSGVFSRGGGSGSSNASSPPGVSQSGDGQKVVVGGTGNQVTVTNNDFSTKLYLTTNISVFAAEYEKSQGRPLTDEALKRQIEQAVSEAVAGRGSDSLQLFEALSRQVPLPSIYNNLGVEYARAGKTAEAQRAFTEAIRRDPQQQDARTNLAQLAKMAAAPSRPTSPALTVESSTLPTIAIEPLTSAPAALQEVHIVDSGTSLGSSYRVKYSAKPGSSTIVEPGTYDVVFKSSGGGTFVLADNVDVKERQLVRINPAALVGYLQVEPLTRPGFPPIKDVTVFKAGTTGYRFIFQRSESPGELIPIAPGAYEVVAKTTEDQDFTLAKSVEVKALETQRIPTNDEVAAFVVHDPKVAGSNVELVYVLRAGTTQIAAESKQFERPLLVQPGEAYDIALKQPAGLTRIRTGVIAKRGELTAVP